VIFDYDLTLGLPHTNYRGLSEPLLLMHAGHFLWQSLAAAIGRPLSELRTTSGGEVYAAFYYIEEIVPEAVPLESFRLDDTVHFTITLRSFKNIAAESVVHFGPRNSSLAAQPSLRFGNIFITPEKGNSVLRVAPPANADFSKIPRLPNDENPYHLTQRAGETGRLDLMSDGWTPTGTPFEHEYDIDIDRDTNGAGLVYFANYIAFMETAERLAYRSRGEDGCDRSLRHRRTAYFGNADPGDSVLVRVSTFTNLDDPGHRGHRYTIDRLRDGRLICLSETIKCLCERPFERSATR
jgi:probable biosynthetic protein (TIGR04098 family)